MTIFYCLRSSLPQPGGPGSHIYIHRNMAAHLYPKSLGSFSLPPTTRTNETESKSELSSTDGQSASLSWCQVTYYLGPVTNFSYFSLKLSLDSCGFVIMGRPLWRGYGSIIHSRCCEIVSAVFLRSEFGGTHDQILLSQIWVSPNLFIYYLFISPRNRVAQLYPQAMGDETQFLLNKI
jgi:hypothetical protein